ncbi:DUF1851 domain-containing protein [Vibrio clamense]|uniref:T6SS immunity protein Tdi1 domain-containing protein n=1 Tax=Vibrio clamense TaxID=2910254 RepID=UPI003D24B3B7
MTLNDLTVDFSHVEREKLLSSWIWLIGERKLPILISSSGDAFVQDIDDGSISFLDTGSPTLDVVASSYDEFSSLLSNKEFVVNYLAVAMVGDLIQSGKKLKSGEIYSLIKPCALGGEYSFDNIEPCDVDVHFSILGQLTERVCQLPQGV